MVDLGLMESGEKVAGSFSADSAIADILVNEPVGRVLDPRRAWL